MSEMRKEYMWQLVFRCVVFVLCVGLCLLKPEQFSILPGMMFFDHLSVLHLLWLLWVIDMIYQIIPLKNKVALGSQKLFANRFRPIREKINREALRHYVITTTKAAYKVMVLWVALIAALGVLYYRDIIGPLGLFLFCVAFYVCDLICVLVWCPFRLIMKNKCCTTCRIFNWDHIMMFSPLIFVGGFFCWSLFILSAVAWLVWEVFVMLYPERFWEMSNAALQCSTCTDKLCTQYCQKLRRKRKML